MEEKVLIKSEQYNVKKFFVIMLMIGCLLALFSLVYLIVGQSNFYNRRVDTYELHLDRGYCYSRWSSDECYDCKLAKEYGSGFEYALAEPMALVSTLMAPTGFFALVGGLIYLWLRSYELTVTDKRIFGKVAWGKRVDLPADSVSATATSRFLKGVSVSTSSGRISFRMLKNADAIYQVISNLLIERQQAKVNPVTVIETPKDDVTEQLKKFKELQDLGVITQEEFDTKKKQLLNM